MRYESLTLADLETIISWGWGAYNESLSGLSYHEDILLGKLMDRRDSLLRTSGMDPEPREPQESTAKEIDIQVPENATVTVTDEDGHNKPHSNVKALKIVMA